jgi:hypothetical protein
MANSVAEEVEPVLESEMNLAEEAVACLNVGAQNRDESTEMGFLRPLWGVVASKLLTQGSDMTPFPHEF